VAQSAVDELTCLEEEIDLVLNQSSFVAAVVAAVVAVDVAKQKAGSIKT
jgi:hypothetical protein